MKKLLNLKLKFVIVSLLAAFSFYAAPQTVMAAGVGPFSSTQSQQQACSGITVGNGNPCTGSSGSTLGNIVTVIINIMSMILGAVAIIMIIIAGFKFVTSGGDSNGVASARNTLIYAIVGLVVVALGQVLVHFVINTVNK